jgi:hypothetical protein
MTEPTISEALSDVEALLLQLERTRLGIVARMDSLRKEREGLRLAQARVAGRPVQAAEEATVSTTTRVVPSVSLPTATTTSAAPAMTGSTASPSLDWTGLDRTSAVQLAMRQLAKPLDRNDIAHVLAMHGRNDQLDDISAALSYLRRKEYAQRQDDGRWILIGAGLAIGVGLLIAGSAAG